MTAPAPLSGRRARPAHHRPVRPSTKRPPGWASTCVVSGCGPASTPASPSCSNGRDPDAHTERGHALRAVCLRLLGFGLPRPAPSWWEGSCGSRAITEQVSWLALQDFTDPGESGEPDRLGASVLEHGQIDVGHADPVGKSAGESRPTGHRGGFNAASPSTVGIGHESQLLVRHPLSRGCRQVGKGGSNPRGRGDDVG